MENKQTNSTILIVKGINTLSDNSRDKNFHREMSPLKTSIIVLSDDDDITHSNEQTTKSHDQVPSLAQKLNEDDVLVVDVRSVEKPSFYNYYDGGIVNETEVKKRWRVKTLADPKRNLTNTNYRKRLYKENNSLQAIDRNFFSFILGNESKSSNEAIKLQNEIDDKKVLNEKIKEIQRHFNNLIESNENKLRDQEAKLHQTFLSHKNSLKLEYESKFIFLQLIASQHEIHRLAQELKDKHLEVEKSYENVLLQCRSLYRAKSNELCFSCKNRIDALNTLFKSGKYEKGKLGEYFSLTVNQGVSIRRKYFDDGERLILLPEDKLKFILIEDLIYNYFYVKNK